jgi:hypothetical protein
MSNNPTWDDFRVHTFIGVGSWMGLVILGLVAASLRHLWDVERVTMLLTPAAVFVVENMYYLLFQAVLAAAMFVLYILWVQNDTIMDTGNLIEDIICYIYAAEILLLTVYNCAMSQDDIVSFAGNRLFF